VDRHGLRDKAISQRSARICQYGRVTIWALIVVDMQTGFLIGDSAVPDAGRLVARVTDLLERARRAGALVVHLRNDGVAGAIDEPGSPGWRLYLPVRSSSDEMVIRKTEDDGFEGTGLADLLGERHIDAVVVCGLMSEMCVSATARTALARGLRVLVPHDSHATYDIPAAPSISEAIPAAIVSRVAEWALGDRVEIVAHGAEIVF